MEIGDLIVYAYRNEKQGYNYPLGGSWGFFEGDGRVRVYQWSGIKTPASIPLSSFILFDYSESIEEILSKEIKRLNSRLKGRRENARNNIIRIVENYAAGKYRSSKHEDNLPTKEVVEQLIKDLEAKFDFSELALYKGEKEAIRKAYSGYEEFLEEVEKAKKDFDKYMDKKRKSEAKKNGDFASRLDAIVSEVVLRELPCSDKHVFSIPRQLGPYRMLESHESTYGLELVQVYLIKRKGMRIDQQQAEILDTIKAVVEIAMDQDEVDTIRFGEPIEMDTNSPYVKLGGRIECYKTMEGEHDEGI